MLRISFFTGLSFICLCWADLPLRAADPSPEQLEFFEKQVRPLLVERCQKCHGSDQQKGGLRLDSRDALLKGGDSGPAIQPGDVEAGLLIDAINYDPDGYQMPPTGKLAPEQIAVLTEWVRQGAPWPKEQAQGAGNHEAFNLAERARHWSFQPLGKSAIPSIQHRERAGNPVDSFLIASLERAGLQPAPSTEKSALLRRLSYELTGLPPTPEELELFLADPAPDAYERLVDRLLASPHYGERWARHWMDLVRYAETYGHEFDYEIRYAVPYRDYLIRAWNADVPYDQFVREHLAGDLLPQPRRDAASGNQESVIGTAFWWFSQGKHSPVDIRSEECDTVDNQLDVFGKTFLGLTIACARCHDHKFDPITQKDYYALAGYLQSSRQTYADIHPPELTQRIVSELKQHDRDHAAELISSTLDRLETVVHRLADLLRLNPTLDPSTRDAFHQRLKQHAENDPRHPFHLWAKWSAAPEQLAARQAELLASLEAPPANSSESFLPRSNDEPARWFAEGFAFDTQPLSRLQWLTQASAERPVRGVVAPQIEMHSGRISPKLQGTLRSPTFTITKPHLDILAYRRGGSPHPAFGDYKAGQVHIVVDGFQIIKDPLWGMLTTNVAQRESAVWYRRDVSRFLGSQAYFEIDDPDDGEIIVEQIRLSDQPLPVARVNQFIAHALTAETLRSIDDVAHAYQAVFERLIQTLRQESLSNKSVIPDSQLPAVADLINWLLQEEPLLSPSLSDAKRPPPNASFAQRRAELEAAIPHPLRTLAMAQGTLENEHLLIRGNHKKIGDEVPRRFLEVFGDQPDPNSTRLNLADDVAGPTNPLTPRVIVNRLWQHQFGRGLVPTSDDFGKMGQPPTHLELLDWLAAELIRGEWSLKRMQRLLVTSQAFHMSSRPQDAVAAERDPENKLLHRANLQRLEAEALRDSLLLMSDRLDDRLYGPSVLPHLTEFMEGRGRPKDSGPLDGNGRRSLYVNVRRNFLTPMFLAFDFPTPFTTMGRRSSSNVPAQALTLMNNPFVIQQAALWIAHTDPSLPLTDRIDRLYRSAFSRPATQNELRAAEEFLKTQSLEYGSPNDPRAWTDLAHVLLNVKEFVFIE